MQRVTKSQIKGKGVTKEYYTIKMKTKLWQYKTLINQGLNKSNVVAWRKKHLWAVFKRINEIKDLRDIFFSFFFTFSLSCFPIQNAYVWIYIYIYIYIMCVSEYIHTHTHTHTHIIYIYIYIYKFRMKSDWMRKRYF